MNRHVIATVCCVVMAVAVLQGVHRSADASEQEASAAKEKRRITADDLIRLRDIEAWTASPNGKLIAFHLRQASVGSNTYSASWHVLPLSGEPHVTDVGDAGIIRPRPRRSGLIADPVAPTSTPRWSPDSRKIAYLKESDSEVQVWVSDAATGGQRQMTHSLADVVDFQWSREGDRIYFETLLHTRDEAVQLFENEGDSGFRYDERFKPAYSVQPLVPRERSSEIWVQYLEAGELRQATATELAAYDALKQKLELPGRPGARFVSLSKDEERAAWAQPTDASATSGRIRMPVLQIVAGSTSDSADSSLCRARECVGLITSVWIDEKADEVVFGRREGLNNTEFGYYAWSPMSDEVRTLYRRPGELLRDCIKAGRKLVCGYETPKLPARIATIDIETGVLQTIFDPNPEFADLGLGEVRRLEWPIHGSSWADNGFGHFVLPPTHDPAKKYPLVVTQYYSHGFLRGGVGDEYPIHVFAANEIAVLSIERPIPWKLMQTALYDDDVGVQGRMFNERPNDWEIGLRNISAGLDAVFATGMVDPDRVGISGLSDGAVKAFYALANSDQFAAAAVSSPAWDPILFFTSDSQYRQKLNAWGFTNPYAARENLWRTTAPVFSIERVTAPILMQIADSELIPMSQTITMLSEHNKPFDAYVFPEEYHVKWQPKHRYAIYKRSVDWFRFWLLGEEDPDTAKAAQYDRWRKLREQCCARIN